MVHLKKNLFALYFLLKFVGICARLEKRCGSTKNTGKLVSAPANEYLCPRENDPVTYTECCDNGSCCEKRSLLSEFDEELVMIIAVTVITICVILMAVMVICCFWSKCPCYTTCRANYTASETIIYSLSKENPNILMPNENEGSQYAPCLVKIKKVEEF